MRETRVRSLSREDPLAKEMATHSSIFAWRIPWREEPGGLQFTGVAKRRTGLSDLSFFLSNLGNRSKLGPCSSRLNENRGVAPCPLRRGSHQAFQAAGLAPGLAAKASHLRRPRARLELNPHPERPPPQFPPQSHLLAGLK